MADRHFSQQLSTTLQQGGVVVMKTDTIYGVVGQAANKETVERIYRIKQRTPTKSPIVLIGDVSQMFDTYADIGTLLADYWPGPNSIILPSQHGPDWITRGNGSIAYRLPDNQDLQELIRHTGPLIAPSANPEGELPARTIEEARQYFGDGIDHYEDSGLVETNTPSSLYSYTDRIFKKFR